MDSDSIKEIRVNIVVECAIYITVVNNKDMDNDMGPHSDATGLSRVPELVQEAIQNCANVLYGGGKPNKFKDDGYFYEPTVIDNVKPSIRVFKEDVFGPVITICNFNNNDDVLNETHNTDEGLTAYIFTDDQIIAYNCATKLRF